MLEEDLIITLEEGLQETRNVQNRLMVRLRVAESEVEDLRTEINALEQSASKTEKSINQLLVATRSGSRMMSIGKTLRIEAVDDVRSAARDRDVQKPNDNDTVRSFRRDNPVAYINQSRGIPSINSESEPLTARFSDRTITQSCTLLLRESDGPLHVNELYNLLRAGGFVFKGSNPTISVAVSLSRNKRFRKTGPGTFELVIREARKTAS